MYIMKKEKEGLIQKLCFNGEKSKVIIVANHPLKYKNNMTPSKCDSILKGAQQQKYGVPGKEEYILVHPTWVGTIFVL